MATTVERLPVVGDDPEKYGLTVRVVNITPEVAGVWLQTNRGNRNAKKQNIARYMRDMAEGEWLLTGQPIIFDNTGALRNGQNRLMACIESDSPFTSVVIWGVEPSTFRNMDTGPARTYGDVLTIATHGEVAHVNALGAVAAMVWRWENGYRIVGGGQAVNPTHSEVLDLIERHPLLPLSIEPGVRASRMAELRPPRIGSYSHYRFAAIDRDAADEFFSKLSNLTFGKNDDAVRELHLALKRMGERERSHRDAFKVLYYVLKTWRVWRGIDPPIGKFQVGGTLPTVE